MDITGKKLINVWKKRGDKSVGVLYEDESGKRFTVTDPVDWYFVIREDDYKKAAKVKKKYDLDIRSSRHINFPGWVRVHCDAKYDKHPHQHTRMDVVAIFEKEGIRTYEGDLDVVQRWYIDTQMEIASNFNKLYFDIETQDELGKIEIGAERVISFAGIDNKGRSCFYYLKDLTDAEEVVLLRKILKAFKEYDIVLGWNSREFDIPYLRERMRRLDIHKNFPDEYNVWYRMAEYDLLARFRHQFRFDSSLRSFSLDYISKHFLGKGKIEYGKGRVRIIDLWRENKPLLKEYNFEDAKLVKELDEKLGVSDMMILQSSWCRVPVSKFGLYRIIDAYILNVAHRSGMYELTSMSAVNETIRRRVLREQEEKAGKSNKAFVPYSKQENPNDTSTEKQHYHGGLVLTPTPGLYPKVYTLDFKSLYPSIMKTCNVGHETLRYENDGDCIINPGTLTIERKDGALRPTYFIKEKSTINKSISELLLKRKEYKKKKLQMIEDGTNHGPEWDLAVSNEIVVKEVANSMYGIMGMEYGRYFAIDIAESITLFGQWIIKSAKEFFELQGYEVIYGDTDSVFLSTGKAIDIYAELDKYHEWLGNRFKNEFNIDEHFIELEFDKEYDGLILVAKKTYAGHVVNIEGKKTDDIYSRGVEFNKRGTFSYGAKKQKELVEWILTEMPKKARVTKWLIDTYDDFCNTEFTKKELSISHKVGKNLDAYTDVKISKKVVSKKDKEFRPEMYSVHFDMDDEEHTIRKQQTLPLHVRIAKRIKEKTGEFYKNTEVEYIVTSHDTKIDGIHADDFTGEFCREYYWENKTLPLLTRIINVTHPGIDTDELFKKTENVE